MNKIEIIQADLKENKKAQFTTLKKEMEKLITSYNKKGYKVNSIIPLTSGEYEMIMDLDSTGGFGFGYTSGIIIVFEKV